MRKTLFILSVLAFSFYLYGCKDSTTNSGPPVDTTPFKYPFTDGSTWNYSRTQTAADIRPDSIRHYFNNYPITAQSTITILYDTVINGITTKCFYEIYQEPIRSWHSRSYYANNDTACLSIAYRNFHGGLSFPSRPANNLQFSFNKKYYSSFELLNNFFLNGNEFNKSNSDSLFINNPPRRCLIYPITAGREWEFFNSSGLISHKKYLLFENLNVNNQIISCIKTERTYTAIDSISFYDYHSKYGQIKRDYFFDDIEVTDEFGRILGTVDYRDVVTLNSFTINP